LQVLDRSSRRSLRGASAAYISSLTHVQFQY
jgi:hypothetical protein